MRFAVALFLSCFSVASSGHHSRAEFSDETREISGELLTIVWREPHPIFTLKVEDQPDMEGVWEIQSFGSRYTLTRAGVTRDQFSVGDRVTLYGSQSTQRENLFLVNNMLTAEGVELVFDRRSSPVWNAIAVGGEEDYIARESDFVDAATENRGLFRLWSRLNPANEGGDRHVAPSLTAEAASFAASLEPIRDYTSLRCQPKGMPWVMASPHPYELFDEGDEIKILSHEGNATRTVHMNGADDPSQQAPSYLGYSVGRWDESTLVVETSRINWSLYRPGIPQSELVTIVERFSLSEDQRRLHYQSTTTDSETFTTPGILERYYGALGETVTPYECEVDE